MLSARGLDPARIQAMGRWRSPLVLHYATEALSTGLASLVERQRPTVSTSADAATEMAALRRLLTQLEKRVATVEALEPARAAAAAAAADASRPPPELVQNTDSKSLHRPSARRATHTYCGWWWQAREHRRLDAVPEDLFWKRICAYCLPAEREIARVAHESRSAGVTDSESD